MSSVAIRHLNTAAPDFEAEFQRVLHWSAETDHAIEERVAAILQDVQQRGDAAVIEYTNRFDGMQAESMAALEASWNNRYPSSRRRLRGGSRSA